MHSFLLFAAAAAIVSQDPAASRGDKLVKVELLADRASIRPGEAFSLGVRFRIERQWHIYWENHGDSGLPTRASLSGPAGFEIGPARHPGPLRHEEEGDIVSYVHEGEVLFVADVRAPEALEAGKPAAFEVEARWLVCKEICLPGSAKARIEIPLAGSDAPSAPANEAIFAAARARMPRPWKDLAGAALAWSGDESAPTLTVSVPGHRDLELFPLASESLTLVSREVDASGASGRLTARFRYRPQPPDEAPRLRAVVRVGSGKSETFYDLDTSPKTL
jgi:DsbC/DsbD-like thiol-disulfide interchange protein